MNVGRYRSVIQNLAMFDVLSTNFPELMTERLNYHQRALEAQNQQAVVDELLEGR